MEVLKGDRQIILDNPAVLGVGVGDENHLTSGRTKMPRIARLIGTDMGVRPTQLTDMRRGHVKRGSSLPLTLDLFFVWLIPCIDL